MYRYYRGVNRECVGGVVECHDRRISVSGARIELTMGYLLSVDEAGMRNSECNE